MLLAALMATLVAPQATQPARLQGKPPVPATDQRRTDDIVVEGLRDLNDPNSAVTHATLGSGRVGPGARISQSVFALAMRFAKCAVTREPHGLDMLHAALDGRINGAAQSFSQGRFVSLNASCAQDPRIARSAGIATIASGYDTTYYDRGAMYVRALQVFAPDLKLTKQQTGDPAIQARFDAREISLAKFRLPVDRSYFETAVCLVRLQPELAVRLIKTDRSTNIARLEAMIVNGSRPCVSNARKVYFDPAQFRFYMADAVYRWAVAARGVESLLPADAAAAQR